MFLAIALIGLGAALIASALKGIGLVDYLGGAVGDTLDPRGGRGGSAPDTGGDGPGGHPSSGGVAPGVDPKGEFKGPNAALLRFIDDNARKNFNLRRTELCRSPNATYGAGNSLHKECRAGDYVGSVEDKVAFARWAKPLIDRVGGEVFCDQAGMVAPGFEHASHAHVGA